MRRLRVGGTMPATLNAANEIAVAAYLHEQIAFHDIAEVIRGTMEAHSSRRSRSIDDALEADRWAREKAGMLVRSLAPLRCVDAEATPYFNQGATIVLSAFTWSPDAVWLFTQKVWWFLLVLGVLVAFHELGHFLAARWVGVKVLKFSLGFGPKLFGRQVGETEYLVSAVPLGGYVKLFGEEETDALTPGRQTALLFPSTAGQ